MKNQIVLTIFILLLSFSSTFAQRQIDISSKVATLTERYQLNETQKTELIEIQERRNRNLSAIQELKEDDPALYLRKRVALQKGTEASVRRILSKDQLKVYRDHQIAFRKAQAKLKGELRESGVDQAAIQSALLDQYDETF